MRGDAIVDYESGAPETRQRACSRLQHKAEVTATICSDDVSQARGPETSDHLYRRRWSLDAISCSDLCAFA